MQPRYRAVLAVPALPLPAGLCWTAGRIVLKVGIDKDILAADPELNPEIVKLVLRIYVTHETYREVMIEGAGRVDLDGNPAGVVTKSQAEWSAMKWSGRWRTPPKRLWQKFPPLRLAIAERHPRSERLLSRLVHGGLKNLK
jgi:hypothetical protein